MEPLKLLLGKFKILNLLNSEIRVGSVPAKWLLDKSSLCKCLQCKRPMGEGPVKALRWRVKAVRLERAHIEEVRLPEMEAPVRSTTVTLLKVSQEIPVQAHGFW
ncbi:hypothetical protein SUGI_1487080 [Cryptomeria japonica]|uniref:Uncharacterized protein n=1 Tax=Cryptomeria japonica TaxID=3369 RepID=A0AAD3NSN8_CRYJA|nr:hypothetical protein SUGI_1487080 [Cryptomeria japonica]